LHNKVVKIVVPYWVAKEVAIQKDIIRKRQERTARNVRKDQNRVDRTKEQFHKTLD
jgi:hypothetical protein